MACETLKHPDLAKALVRILQLNGSKGNAYLEINKVIKVTPPSNGDNTSREFSLRELIVARALYRCGDYKGMGKKTLEAYSNDFRGHYAIHAKAILAENVPATPYSEKDYEEMPLKGEMSPKIALSAKNKQLQAAMGVVTIGSERCANSSLKLTRISDELSGSQYLAVPRGDRAKPGSGYEMTIKESGTLYLLAHDRGKISKTKGWNKTNLVAHWSIDDWNGKDLIYSKSVSA